MLYAYIIDNHWDVKTKTEALMENFRSQRVQSRSRGSAMAPKIRQCWLHSESGIKWLCCSFQKTDSGAVSAISYFSCAHKRHCQSVDNGELWVLQGATSCTPRRWGGLRNEPILVLVSFWSKEKKRRRSMPCWSAPVCIDASLDGLTQPKRQKVRAMWGQ